MTYFPFLTYQSNLYVSWLCFWRSLKGSKVKTKSTDKRFTCIPCCCCMFFGSLMVFFRSATVVVEIASQSLRSSDPTRTSFQLVPASYSYQLPTRTSFQRCQLGLFQNSLLAIVSAVSAVRDQVVTTELE